MRAFISVGFTNGQVIGSKLLVHKPVGSASIRTQGGGVEKGDN